MNDKQFKLLNISKIVSNNKHIGYNLIAHINNTNWYICIVNSKLKIVNRDLKVLHYATVSQLYKDFDKLKFLIPNSLLCYLVFVASNFK